MSVKFERLPADQSYRQDEVDVMRPEIRRLRAEVESLKREIVRLNAKLADYGCPTEKVASDG